MADCIAWLVEMPTTKGKLAVREVKENDASLLGFRLVGQDHCRANDVVNIRVIAELG